MATLRPAPDSTGTLPRTSPAQATEEVARLLPLRQTPQSRDDLMQRPGFGHRGHFRRTYLLPALEAGLLERTIPEKPQSSKQRYRLTAKGHEWLRQQGLQ